MCRAERIYPPCKRSLRILDVCSAPISALLGVPRCKTAPPTRCAARCRRTGPLGSPPRSTLSPACLALPCSRARICPQPVLGLSSSCQCRWNTANAASFAPKPSTHRGACLTMRAALNISSCITRADAPALGWVAHGRVLPMQRVLTDQPQQIHRHCREGAHQVVGVELARGQAHQIHVGFELRVELLVRAVVGVQIDDLLRTEGVGIGQGGAPPFQHVLGQVSVHPPAQQPAGRPTARLASSAGVTKVDVFGHQAGRPPFAAPALDRVGDEVVGHAPLHLAGLHR
jgi:hypothetical protein